MPLTPTIRQRFLMGLLLLLVLLLVPLWFFLDGRFLEWRETAHRASLERNTHLLQNALERRMETLTHEATLVAERLSASLPGHDNQPLPSRIWTYSRLCLDLAAKTPSPLFIVTDSSGRLLFDSYQLPESLLALRQGREPLLTTCLIESKSPPLTAAPWPNVQTALQGDPTTGLFVYGMDFVPRARSIGRWVFASRTLPLRATPEGAVEGVLVLGFPLNDPFVAEFKDITDNPIVVEVGGRVLASTWGPTVSKELEELLSGITGKADASLTAPHPPASWPLRWRDKDWDLVYLPLLESRGIRIGHCVMMQAHPPPASLQKAFRRVWLSLAIAGLLLALAIGWLLSRPLTRALSDLRRATDLVTPGERPPEVDPASEEVADLAGSIRKMVSRLSEQERVRRILGKKVSPEISQKILASGDSLAVRGERRRCCVLFARLTGLKPTEGEEAPERWIAELNEVLEALAGSVLDQQGTVDRFGNGTLKAFWGAPVTLEGQERRCLASAFEMRHRLETLNQRRASQGASTLFLSIGLHSGPMLAGYLGSEQNSDYTLLGEESEKAETLSRLAHHDQILSSAAFFKVLSNQALFRRLEPSTEGGEPTYEAVAWDK